MKFFGGSSVWNFQGSMIWIFEFCKIPIFNEIFLVFKTPYNLKNSLKIKHNHPDKKLQHHDSLLITKQKKLAEELTLRHKQTYQHINFVIIYPKRLYKVPHSAYELIFLSVCPLWWHICSFIKHENSTNWDNSTTATTNCKQRNKQAWNFV